MPKRPKGRWLFGLLLLTICGFVGYQVWNTFFRYRAHGIVEGRLIQVSPPWDGVVHYVHVREGDRVRQGQPLMTVHSVELSQRRDRLACELQIAQATLEAEASKLKWQASFHSNQSQKAVSEYYETSAKLLQEKTRLETLLNELEIARRLGQPHAIAARELRQLEISVDGQRQNIEKLHQSLAELKERAEQTDHLTSKRGDLADGLAEAGHDQLKPHLARIQGLQAELTDLQKRLDQGQVCAPANGMVIKTQRFAGEYCGAADPLVTILEEGSLQVTLYVPQKASTLLSAGQEVDLIADPNPQPVRCKVVRLGDQYVPAPSNIQSQYLANEKLLPVYLCPKDNVNGWMTLRVAEVVKWLY